MPTTSFRLVHALAIATIAFGSVTAADAQRSRGSSGGGARAGTANTGHKAKSHHSTSAGKHHNTSAHRTSTASRSTNVNRNTNVNANRNVNVNVNNGGYGYNGRPVARAATVGAMAVTTGAIIGNRYRVLPSNCATVVRPSGTYHHCGSAWYQSQSGEYIVVTAP